MKSISLDQAVALIPDGSSLMIGGFMGVGTPERIVDEIVRQRKKDLTVIANDTAVPGAGIGKLVHAKLVRAAIVSHIGLNPETQAQMMAGELDVQLVPQGTLIEQYLAFVFCDQTCGPRFWHPCTIDTALFEHRQNAGIIGWNDLDRATFIRCFQTMHL